MSKIKCKYCGSSPVDKEEEQAFTTYKDGDTLCLRCEDQLMEARIEQAERENEENE